MRPRRGDVHIETLKRACLQGDALACEQVAGELLRRGLVDDYLKFLLIWAALLAPQVEASPRGFSFYGHDYLPREEATPEQHQWHRLVKLIEQELERFDRPQKWNFTYGGPGPTVPGHYEWKPSYRWYRGTQVQMEDEPIDPGETSPVRLHSYGAYRRGRIRRMRGRRPVVVVRGPHAGRVDWLAGRSNDNAVGLGVPPMGEGYTKWLRQAKLKNIPMQAKTVGYPLVGVYDRQIVSLPTGVFNYPDDLPIFLPPHPEPDEAPEGFYETNPTLWV